MSSIAFEGRETKKHDFGTILLFFKFFKLLEIWKYNLVSTYTHASDKLSILSELLYFSVRILTRYKTDLKHAGINPVTSRILFGMYL